MRRPSVPFAVAATLVLLMGLAPGPTPARAQAPAVLVIEGATLIDGNGGPPLADSAIVIQGNRIARVSRRGQEAYPAGATIIDARGRYVVPGYFDAQVSYSWYFAEPLLRYGVTSTIDVGTSGETAVPYRDAVFHGRLRAPRTFTSVSRLNAEADRGDTGLESRTTPSRVPASADDARRLVRLWIDTGADYVILDDGSLPPEVAAAAFDEAKRAGTPVFTRAYGPVMFPADAARLGSVSLPHSAGVGIAVTKDPSKWTEGRDDRNELDRYAEMDEAKAAALVALLVEHDVALVPTFVINFPGYPRDWDQFVAEGHQLFSDPDLRAYYPQSAIDSVFGRFARVDEGEVRERRLVGYRNALRFHRMFVEAGGRLVVSGNTNSTKAPGLDLHHEVLIMDEAGVAPMQILQGLTKWPAEMAAKDDRLGTVEPGKLADLVILRANPLEDVRNLRAIDAVLQDGRIVDRGYHATYADPFLNDGGPSVEGLPWVVALKDLNRGGGSMAPAVSPQPAIERVAPLMVTQGAGSATVTVMGLNFVRGSVVLFNGRPVASRTLDPQMIEVTLDAEALRAVGQFDLVVRNPEPIDPLFVRGMWGTGTSNVAHVLVNYQY